MVHRLRLCLCLAAALACAQSPGGPVREHGAPPAPDSIGVTAAGDPGAAPGGDPAAGAAPADGSAPAAPATPPATTPPAPPPPFRFVAWGDTKVTGAGDGPGAVLQALSGDAQALDPPAAFTLYLGDLEEVGFSPGGASAWTARLDGGDANGTSHVTFVTRGNHDAIGAASAADWQAYFDFAGVARTVGATAYTELDPDLTYSFDYGNAHFVCLDAPGDFPAKVTARQLAWLDQDLAAAEARGLTHAFLFWHGPVYSVTSAHPIDERNPPQAIRDLLAVVGRHPIVSALFNGHEHLLAYTHVGPARFPTTPVPHEFEQFTIGAGGANYHDALPGRGDAAVPYVAGFAAVDVDGRSFTVTWYPQGRGAIQGRFTFTKG
jgi:hypothetical protein